MVSEREEFNVELFHVTTLELKGYPDATVELLAPRSRVCVRFGIVQATTRTSKRDVSTLRSFTMPMFICRWQNGDFSAVSAQSREEAIELLAEVADAGTCDIFTTNNFMVHFHIKNEPNNFEDMLPVNFAGFGEQTHRMLCERIYPAYCAAISEIDKDRPQATDVPREKFAAASELLTNALSTEKKRKPLAETGED